MSGVNVSGWMVCVRMMEGWGWGRLGVWKRVSRPVGVIYERINS